MTPPTRHDVHAAAKIVGKSVSWMYQQGAARNIPRTKIGHNVSWTDEQLAQIILGGAQQPKEREQKPPQRKRNSAPAKTTRQRKRTPAPLANAANIPTADFTVSRLYRETA